MKRAIALLLPLTLLAQQPPSAPVKKNQSQPRKAAAPKQETVAVPAAAVASSDTSLGLRFGAPRLLRPPRAESFTLPNGLRVLISENREIPMVNLFALVRAGTLGDPAGQAGLAEVTAMLVRTGGTEPLTASAFQERLVQLDATFESAVAESRAQFALRAPSTHFAAVGPLLRDVLSAPRFDPEAVDTTLGQFHDAISQRANNPVAALNRIFRQRLFDASSPWGRMPEFDTLDNIARAEIEEFHRRYYAPAQTELVIEGDVSAAEAKAKVEEWFGAWTAKAAPLAMPEQPKAPGEAMLFADRNDLRLAGFVLGHLGGRAADPDYAAMILLCDVLSAAPDGRLPLRVREAGGWRADWSATWEAGFDRPGEFAIRATLEAAYTTQAIAIAKDELAKLRAGQIADRDIEAARTRLLARLALRAQGSADQALERGVAEFHGLPPDLMARTYQTLATVTKADVARAAARNFLAEQLVVVTGSSTLFDKPLTTISSKVEPVDLLPQNARPMKARTDAGSLERGRLALAKMQEAMGGQAKLAAIRDASLRFEGSVLFGDSMTPIKLWDRWVSGGIYRQDQEYSSLSRAVFYNGKIGWIAQPGAVAPLAPAMLGQVRGELFRLPFRLALSGEDPARQVADLGGNVLQITEGDRLGIRVYLDPKTGLPQRFVYRTDFGNGLSVAIEELLSEWKEFDGIKLPTKAVTKKNGRRSDELTMVEAKFNGGLKAADLEKKP